MTMEKYTYEVPRHVGIIMDGNGRWAKMRKRPRSFGHVEGSKSVYDIVARSAELGVDSLSLYAFSTENWKRPAEEVEKILSLLGSFLDTYFETLMREEIRLVILGEVDPFPPKVRRKILETVEATKNHRRMTLNIALNYGGQQEIVRAATLFAEDVARGEQAPCNLTPELFEHYLYTKGQPPLDLLIRPSGELRVSNFLLYQLAYAEMVFTPCLWPDFTVSEYERCLEEYGKRHRRFGGLG